MSACVTYIQEENPEFCWKCQALLNSRYPQELITQEFEETAAARIRRRPDRKDLQREIATTQLIEDTAADGCPPCSQLLDCLSTHMRTAMREHWEMSKEKSEHPSFVSKHSLYVDGEQPPFLLMEHDLPLSKVKNAAPEIKAMMQLFPASGLGSLVSHRPVDGNTNSRSSRAVVTRWMETCVANHGTCNRSTTAIPPLPTRIIDISPEGQLAPRLCRNSHTIPNRRYTTLSHCWGSHLPLRLLKNNISALEQSIPVSQLSKTFMDAMIIAQHLGVRYIWIDCLCIIQDSEEDWQEQSASMAQVYYNSYCNIAAAYASDGRQGCFTNRNPALIESLKVQLNWGPHKGAYYCVKCYFWRMNVLEAPLNRRAWVCQERFLAPRNLYFGATQLYWECCENVACEAFPLRLPDQIGTSALKGIIPQIDGARIRRAGNMEADPALDAFSVWDRIVRIYTSGALSYNIDKLIAISGLAAKIGEDISSKYLAGMWQMHLACQLLWQVRRLQWDVPRARSLQYIAPTWAWTSMTGRIEHACEVRYADGREIIIDIVDAAVELVTENPFGQVKSGFLQIKGNLAKDVVRLEEDRMNRGSYSLSINGSRAGRALLDVDTQEEEMTIYEGLYYLPIQYIPWDSVTTPRSGEIIATPEISGIVLRETGRDTCGEFVRMGQFEISSQSDSFKLACREFSGEENGRKLDYGRNNEWGNKYMITIY